MPESDVWTPGETVRAIKAIGSTVERIETKLDDKLTREDLTRSEVAQARTEALQDRAIADLEGNHSKLMFTALAAALAGAGSIITALVSRAG